MSQHDTGLTSAAVSRPVNLAERHLAEFQALQDVLVRLHVLRCTVVDRDLTELEVDEWTRLTRIVEDTMWRQR